jgi:hypothetical protein
MRSDTQLWKELVKYAMHWTIVGLLSKAVAPECISRIRQYNTAEKPSESDLHFLILCGFCGALRTTLSIASGRS